MNVFIFEELKHVSNYTHTRGGLVVIAKNRERIKDLIREYNKPNPDKHPFDVDHTIKISESEWNDVKVLKLADDQDVKERLYIFPDNGCCGW